MQKEHFDDLSTKIGVSLNVTNDMNIEEGPTVVEHEVLSLINLSRLKKTALRKEYNDSSVELPWHEVDYIDRSYAEYKKIHGLLDYTAKLLIRA